MALISTRYTYDFVTANLPRDSQSILEIGWGDGALPGRVLLGPPDEGEFRK